MFMCVFILFLIFSGIGFGCIIHANKLELKLASYVKVNAIISQVIEE